MRLVQKIGYSGKGFLKRTRNSKVDKDSSIVFGIVCKPVLQKGLNKFRLYVNSNTIKKK